MLRLAFQQPFGWKNYDFVSRPSLSHSCKGKYSEGWDRIDWQWLEKRIPGEASPFRFPFSCHLSTFYILLSVSIMIIIRYQNGSNNNDLSHNEMIEWNNTPIWTFEMGWVSRSSQNVKSRLLYINKMKWQVIEFFLALQFTCSSKSFQEIWEVYLHNNVCMSSALLNLTYLE